MYGWYTVAYLPSEHPDYAPICFRVAAPMPFEEQRDPMERFRRPQARKPSW